MVAQIGPRGKEWWRYWEDEPIEQLGDRRGGEGKICPSFFKDLCSNAEYDDIDVTFLPLLPHTSSSSGTQAKNIQIEEGKKVLR
jgi:hypothetical protein